MIARASGIDARLIFGRAHPLARYGSFFEARGLAAERVDEMSWANRRYALDIDGHSNAWNNFANRLKLGCCVFKVQSERGFRQW